MYYEMNLSSGLIKFSLLAFAIFGGPVELYLFYQSDTDTRFSAFVAARYKKRAKGFVFRNGAWIAMTYGLKSRDHGKDICLCA